MGNIGRASGGCILCRQRRIKCDQGKPACDRCVKYGRECPGYGDDNDASLKKGKKGERRYVWRTSSSPNTSVRPILVPSRSTSVDSGIPETQIVTFRKASDTKWSKGEPRIVSEGDTFAPTVSFIELNNYIWPALSHDLKEQSLNYLFKSPSLPIFHSLGLEVNFVPRMQQMYDEAAPNSCLRRALAAAAMVNFSNRLVSEKLQQQALTEYGNAIIATNAALRDPTECLKDDTLLTVTLLGLLEFYAGINPTTKSPVASSLTVKIWESHAAGIRTLLKIRGNEIISTERGRWLFMLCHLGSNWGSMFLNLKPAGDDLFEIEDQIMLQQIDWSYPIQVRVRSYFNEVTKFQARVKPIIGATNLLQVSLVDIFTALRDGEKLDLNMMDWTDDDPEWKALPIKSLEDPKYRFSTVLALYRYLDFRVFRHHLAVYFTRIRLHEALTSLMKTFLQFQKQTTSPEGVQTIAAAKARMFNYSEVIRTTIIKLLGSVAYGLGDVDEQGGLRCNNNLSSTSTSSTPSDNTSDVQENPRFASIEVYVPLSALQQSEFLEPEQRAASEFALKRILNRFRLR